MRRVTMSRWFVGGLLTAGVALAFPVSVPADDVKDNQKHERQLQADAKQLDADATRASNTPDGQRRVTERIAKEFKVSPRSSPISTVAWAATVRRRSHWRFLRS